MDDLINRQMAIKEAVPVQCEGEVFMMVQVETLEGLPSAQPDIITCADCRYADGQIADGRYWCKYHEDYMRYCSDAEGRQ